MKFESLHSLRSSNPDCHALNPLSSLEYQLDFTKFKQAVNFVQTIGPLATAREHFLEIDARGTQISLRSSTLSEGVSGKDFLLAREIDPWLKKWTSDCARRRT